MLVDQRLSLFSSQNPLPNAYTLAIAGRQPFVVLHTALLELLTPRELQVGPGGHGGVQLPRCLQYRVQRVALQVLHEVHGGHLSTVSSICAHIACCAKQAVLAHELGHLKCDHGLWLTVANVLASGTVRGVQLWCDSGPDWTAPCCLKND